MVQKPDNLPVSEVIFKKLKYKNTERLQDIW